MGKPRILLRPTSLITKKIGLMKKLFGHRNNDDLIRDREVQRRANPQPIVKEGVPDFLSQTRGFRSTFTTRRQIVLNRHFTEIISDVLSNNLKQQLQASGVTITSIETKAWNKGVTIFYSTRGAFDNNLHIELNSLVGQLRYAISERRLIGRTPHVNFVYDKTIQVDRALEHAFSESSSDNSKPNSSLIVSQKNQLYVSKDLGSHESKLISKKFSAPSDMCNTMGGLNYPHLFDVVALKLERSRGEATRIVSSTGLFPTASPLFRAPVEDQQFEDPTTRILKMKKFLISQRMKSESMARKRRKEELLARDSYKWDLPKQGEEQVEHTPEEEENVNS